MSADRAGVTGSPASCRRRLNAPTSAGRSSWIVSTFIAHELPEAGRADHLLVLAVLEHRAERAVDRRLVERVDAEQVERGQPVDRLGDAGRLLHVALAHARDGRRHLDGQHLGRALHAPPDDLHLAPRVRVLDPVVQAAALDRVVQVARAVRGEHDDRRMRRADRADLRDRHRRVGEQLEQERLEVVVGAVDLVDQQHGRPRPRVLERAQQRPPDQVVGAEQVLLAQLGVALVGQPDADQLARIVPLVQRLGGVDPLVALQPHQRRVEDRGERLRRLGLADARRPLQQQRLGEAEAQEHRGRQAFVDQVVDGGQALRQRLDVGDEVGDLVAMFAARRTRTGQSLAWLPSLRRLGVPLHRPPHARRACTACRCGRPRATRAARRSRR